MIHLRLITNLILLSCLSSPLAAASDKAEQAPSDITALSFWIGQYEPRDGLLRSLYQENPRLYSLALYQGFNDSRLGMNLELGALSFNSAVSNLESYTNLYLFHTGLQHRLSDRHDPINMFIEAGLSVIYLDVVIEDEQLELKVQGERSWTWGSYYRFGASYQLGGQSQISLAITEQNIFGKIYGNVNLSGHSLQLAYRYELP